MSASRCARWRLIALVALVVLAAAPGAYAGYNKCRAQEWRPTLKHAYIQLKGMPPPRNLSQKRILEEELPQPYRVLNPFSPYTHYRTHKRLTIYVDKNGIFEDAECS
ncbi:hypothetical protein IWQ57_000025 [Coemansia nantahalensis]|uniref:Uncharacterized protein n=1 Tax=Coemansia nantahalensis TaxID=2789366 RepID=A0ACC1K8I8_9FUNG|nr:hypothetical protein IWQ57_000025 [Coemansia nantahalensis]